MIDSHCHIAGTEFDADRADVLVRMWGAAVRGAVVIGAGDGMSGNARAVALAAASPGFAGARSKSAGFAEGMGPRLFAVVGLHPHDASQFVPTVIDELRALAADPRVVGIGETGLDYHYDFAPREAQREACAAQLALAAELDLPVVIHQREATADLLDLLRGAAPRPRGVIHCFTGSAEEARAFLDLGFYLSIPGVITFKKSDALRDVVRRLPADRLLVETDSPYLAPVPYRGKRNEPAYLVETVKVLAEVLGMPPDACGALTAENTRALFDLRQ